MPDAEIAALQGRPGITGAPITGAPITGAPIAAPAGGLSLASCLAWAAVGIPILWGVWITLDKVAVLFR
jgi:hypothetical protein